jgi:hypothetical protein
MGYLKKYDKYIRGLAESGPKPQGIGAVGFGFILLLTMPFYVGILFISAVFEEFKWNGKIGIIFRIILSLILICGLLYSGIKFVYYRFIRNSK